MKKILNVDEAIASKIIGTVFTLFTELNGQCFGCLGMLHESRVASYSFGEVIPEWKNEVETYIAIREIKHKPDSPILITGTPHSVSGILAEGGSMFCFSSPFGDPYDLAVATVYGHYHQRKEKVQDVDDLFVDTLLLHLGRWQEKYAHDNDIIMELARAVFKPKNVLA